MLSMSKTVHGLRNGLALNMTMVNALLLLMYSMLLTAQVYLGGQPGVVEQPESSGHILPDLVAIVGR